MGDARAWETLVKSYSGRILNMAYRYTFSYAVAEELTQDVFVKVFENLRSYRRESGSFTSWIMRVGRNLIIDYHRAHKRERHVAGTEELEVMDFEVETAGSNPFTSVYLREKAETLQKGFRRLSAELREAVVLRDIEGFSYLEMADLLGIPEGTVKSRINRGRIELAKALKQARELGIEG